MGKRPKSSRKGKKEWRANISTEDIEDFYDKTTKDALSGGSLADVPSDSLFFLDKSRGIKLLFHSYIYNTSKLGRTSFISIEPNP